MKVICPKCKKVLLKSQGNTKLSISTGAIMKCRDCGVDGVVTEDKDDDGCKVILG